MPSPSWDWPVLAAASAENVGNVWQALQAGACSIAPWSLREAGKTQAEQK